ncbi:protein kinase [Streptomyces sp. NPDC007162]|uniref:serine/threonine-protein kinase n=1 Tax=Streptomyces sp. NPDC007162 TaxID=3156917 RepID=UPI0033E6CFE8
MLVAGRYRLAESIGQGGMGRVWRAADETLDRRVAVKEMRIDGHDAEDTRTRRERTLREARATARIDHPNVVRVYDVVDEGELLWIVMELVVGRSLEHVMAEEGALSPRETARIGLGLVAALRQVHAGGVLHRDIKPGNVLVEDAGARVVLTDFGIAAIQDAKALTMAGMLVGSPDYMAPERIAGRPQGPPSDVWSLGATLCAALAGRSPFSRDTTLATLHAVLYEEPELPSTAGPLHDLLAALLAKDPTARPPLAQVAQSLHPVAHPTPRDHPTPAYGIRPVTSERPEPQRSERSAGLYPSAAPPRGATSHNAPARTPRRKAPRTTLFAALGVIAVATTIAILLTTTTDGGGADRTTTGTSSPAVAGTTRPRSLPPGAHEEPGGFAWAPPTGWRRDVKTGAEVHYTSPDGSQELVAKSSLARGDLMDTWSASERSAHQGRDYAKIRLARTTFRGHPAVVWEYTFTLRGTPWHARLLGFDADGKSYQVNTWYQPAVERQAVRTYERVKESFTLL